MFEPDFHWFFFNFFFNKIKFHCKLSIYQKIFDFLARQCVFQIFPIDAMTFCMGTEKVAMLIETGIKCLI